MISYITGKIQTINKDSLVILTQGGVGYEIQFRISNLEFKINDEVNLYTYLKVSEQAMDLYGFESVEEREFFTLLLTVSGVGPKAAMRVLSLGSISEIQAAISRGDAKYLTAVQGMGQKTAERLCVELKNKIKKTDKMVEASANSEALSEVIDGLTAMGYGKEEAKNIVQSLDSNDKSTEDLLREALKLMSKV